MALPRAKRSPFHGAYALAGASSAAESVLVASFFVGESFDPRDTRPAAFYKKGDYVDTGLGTWTKLVGTDLVGQAEPNPVAASGAPKFEQTTDFALGNTVPYSTWSGAGEHTLWAHVATESITTNTAAIYSNATIVGDSAAYLSIVTYRTGTVGAYQYFVAGYEWDSLARQVSVEITSLVDANGAGEFVVAFKKESGRLYLAVNGNAWTAGDLCGSTNVGAAGPGSLRVGLVGATFDGTISNVGTYTRAISDAEKSNLATWAIPPPAGTDYTRFPGDSVGAPTDASARAVVITRGIANSVTASSDAAARALVAARGHAESVSAPTDVVARAMSASRAVANAVSAASDAASRAAALARTIAESIAAASDAAARAFAGTRAIAQSLSAPTSGVVRVRDAPRSVAESVAAVSDAVARIVALARGITESLAAPTDAAARTRAALRPSSEIVSAPTDGATRTTGLARANGESLASPVDVSSRQFAGTRSAAQSVSAPSATVARSASFSRAYADAASTPTSTVTRFYIGLRSLADALSAPTFAVDAEQAGPGAIDYDRFPSESIAAPTMAVARAVVALRALSNAISVPSDAASRSTAGVRSVANATFAPTDVASRTLAAVRAIANASSAPTDGASRSTSLLRGTADSLLPSTDTWARAWTTSRAAAFSLPSIADVVVATPISSGNDPVIPGERARDRHAIVVSFGSRAFAIELRGSAIDVNAEANVLVESVTAHAREES